MSDGTPPAPAPDAAADPADEAVAFHLDAIRAAREAATSAEGGHRAGGVGAVIDRGRRMADRVTAPVARERSDIDGHLLAAIDALADRARRAATWQTADHVLLGEVRGALHDASLRIDALEEQVRALLADLAAHRERTAAEATELRADLNALRGRQELTLRTVQEAVAGHALAAAGEAAAGIGDHGLEALSEELDRSHDDLYRDLERRFRGDREHVKALAEVYLADVQALPGPVLDVGCGRGEWLELLGEHGIAAYGVDLNAAFAEANQERGLDVRAGDAVAHLAGLPAGTLGAVTGFHLVEHLSFELLISLFDAALQALAPGGIVIFETPDPTNVRVGAAQFWIDPTHLRPMHPQLLEFLLLQRGFHSAEIRPLHPAAHFGDDWAAALGVAPSEAGTGILADVRDALTGPQDYAVIARKSASAPPS